MATRQARTVVISGARSSRTSKRGHTPEDAVPVELAVQVAAGELKRRLDRLVWFAGELVQVAQGRGGQGYAVLRGPGARIEVYVPARHARQSSAVATGTVVVVQGRIGIWQPGGRLQIAAVSPLLPTSSIGARANARQVAELELQAEGTFDRPRRDMPRWPGAIAVVTSARGAAIDDVRATIRRRAPWVSVHLHDCTVQGADGAPSIISALDTANRSSADVILVTRGGGAPDTFDPYNDAAVVRCIAASRLPVIVAVGHDADRTLADLAADRSASTPTAAAELAVPDGEAIRRELRNHRRATHRAARAACAAARARVDQRVQLCRHSLRQRLRLLREGMRRLEPRALSTGLRRLINSERRELAAAWSRARGGVRASIQEFARRLYRLQPTLLVGHGEVGIRTDRFKADELIRAIDALSPERVLERGYALVMGDDGRAIRSSAAVEPGHAIEIRLHDGTVAAVVVAITRSDP